MLDDESIRLFRKTGAWLVPTLLAGRTVAEQAEKGGFLPPAIRDKALRLAPVIRDHIVRAYKAGVRIAFGTDSGVSHHGDNGRELLLLKDIGMENAEIIATATVNAAELLGLADRIGTLEAGKEADIIAVAGDPLADIAALQHVGFVMARGHIAKNEF
ncbi:MAG: amidohydrolase family protein [Rhodothalassiaceae bacterium]